ncbi:ribonuclease P protein component, partial [bacterium]|nr:ribonuclease P protein component [bacterium]
RNRIKRLMRENFRLVIKNNDFPYINDYISIICVARKGTLETDYAEIKESVNKLLKEKLES